jgi:hypothetical protein
MAKVRVGCLVPRRIAYMGIRAADVDSTGMMNAAGEVRSIRREITVATEAQQHQDELKYEHRAADERGQVKYGVQPHGKTSSRRERRNEPLAVRNCSLIRVSVRSGATSTGRFSRKNPHRRDALSSLIIQEQFAGREAILPRIETAFGREFRPIFKLPAVIRQSDRLQSLRPPR